MIQVRGLVKSFGDHRVLRGLDLDVAPGERLAVVGANGAGKTTLLRVLAALARPDAGSVRVGGIALPAGAEEARRLIGFLSHHTLLYDDLTAAENLRFYGRMYDVPGLEVRIAERLEQVGLAWVRDETVRTLSRGMKQRLSIARALLHDPPLLLLDEPYTGLDHQAAATLDRVLAQKGAERTVVLTTHDLERGLLVSGRIVLLIDGQIACQMCDRERDLEVFRRAYELGRVEQSGASSLEGRPQ